MIEQIKNLLSKDQIISGHSIEAKSFLEERRGNFSSECECIVMPKNTSEVVKVVKFCQQNNISIVSQSGNTGLVGGSVSKRNQIILSSKLMNSIIELDKKNLSITLESGVILENLEKTANESNLHFPVSLPSKSECCVGGLIATNAGGISVLKHGNMRVHVLGLEVVLPDGRIFSDLNKLRKRNIGTDIKQLFIGSEGTLGFITKACLKLIPYPKQKVHLLIAINDILEAEYFFHKMNNDFPSLISAFEIINKDSLLLTKKYTKVNLEIEESPWYIITSFDMESRFISLDEYIKSINKNNNAYIISKNENIWDCRYSIPKAQSLHGQSLKHDIAVPLSQIVNFINNSLHELKREYNNKIMPIIFGHMGDGNLHFNISKNENYKGDLFLFKDNIKKILVKNAMKFDGTFSAEHGIGLIHKQEFKDFYLNSSYNEFKNIKKYLDSRNIFNPNKVID